MNRSRCLIFDVDGVLVDSPHQEAWGETLVWLAENRWRDEAQAAGFDSSHYTPDLYQQLVAGKNREEGARALVAHFFEDPDGAKARELAERKQDKLVDLIAQGHFEPFADAIELALRAQRAGWVVAAASSSRNANDLLARLHLERFGGSGRLLELFEANVCGRDIRPGKPAPAIFEIAATEAGVDPSRCAVVEDAPSGIQAAKAAGMVAVGIARDGDLQRLRRAGADEVTTTLDEIDLDKLVRP